jgi:branched-subunit amino acid aminotransferase/4-amino-4-deoxychorismate lyase
MNKTWAYLNGEFVSAADVAVAPDDAGFLWGATVTERLRTFGGRLFRLDEHLERLARSMEIVGIDVGLDQAALGELATELVDRNFAQVIDGDDLGLVIFATPGRDGSAEPTLCLHTTRLAHESWTKKYEQGDALTVTSVEQVPTRCWPPELKCRSRMHYYLADREAHRIDPGSHALLLDAEGHVVEASTANVVIFREGDGLISPPRSRVLPGISLAVLEELAAAQSISFHQRDLRPEDVAAADEVLLTSTSSCLLPVTRFNKASIGRGKPGPMFERLARAWSESVGIDFIAQTRRCAR